MVARGGGGGGGGGRRTRTRKMGRGEQVARPLALAASETVVRMLAGRVNALTEQREQLEKEAGEAKRKPGHLTI